MKHIIMTIFAAIAINAQAQENVGKTIDGTVTEATATTMTATTNEATMLHDAKEPLAEAQPQLSLPSLTEMGTMPSMRWMPHYYGGYHTWNMHEGLNVSLGASVFSTFGSGNTYKGAGFSQNLAMMYAKPLTDRLSIAVGGYFGSMQWAHQTYRDAGITAVLGYQFDEHWSGYVYAQKSLVGSNNMMPYTLRQLNDLGDRIGATVRYDFNPSFSIQVSVEACRQDYRMPYINNHVQQQSDDQSSRAHLLP